MGFQRSAAGTHDAPTIAMDSRNLIALPFQVMDHSIAAEAMSRLSRLSQDVHRPIECGIPDHLSAEDRAALKKRITEIWGSVYFDLMVPLISQYPDLDPDRNAPSGGASRKVGLASKPYLCLEWRLCVWTRSEACDRGRVGVFSGRLGR